MPVAEVDISQPAFGEMPPGPGLALLLGAQECDRLDDFDIVEMARSARRLASWATSLEFGAIAELSARRKTQGERLGAWDSEIGEWVADEVAAALTLSGGAAAREVVVAEQLAEHLPCTNRALTKGLIDTDKAKVIADGVGGCSPAIAGQVEREVLPAASGQTCGQLRYAVRKAVRDADPDAYERRRKEAEEGRRMELWDNDDGTSDLSGRSLPNALANAAFNRVNAIAQGLRADGDPRAIDQLRADVYLALLRNERPDEITARQATKSGCDDPLAQAPDVRTDAAAWSVLDRVSSQAPGGTACHSECGAEGQRGAATEPTEFAVGRVAGRLVPGSVDRGQMAGGAGVGGGVRRFECGAEKRCGAGTEPGQSTELVVGRAAGRPAGGTAGCGRNADDDARGVGSRDADSVSGSAVEGDTSSSDANSAAYCDGHRGARGDVGGTGADLARQERVEDRQQPAEPVGGLNRSERGSGQARAREVSGGAEVWASRAVELAGMPAALTPLKMSRR